MHLSLLHDTQQIDQTTWLVHGYRGDANHPPREILVSARSAAEAGQFVYEHYGQPCRYQWVDGRDPPACPEPSRADGRIGMAAVEE